MRVFITGGSGFIGTRLIQKLVANGHQPICLSRSGPTSARLEALGAQVLSGDLTDAETVKGCLGEAQPTHIAHLAAKIATQKDTDRIHEVNVRGTENLVQASRAVEGLQAFLFVSSVVRGEAAGEVFTEGDAIPATTVYGKSKEVGDELVLSAHAEWQLPSIILRPSHVYGPGGWFAEILSDKMFRIPGKGDNLWDVVHVDDVVSACLLLLETCPVGEVFHVVDDEPLTMKEFFANAARALGRKPYGHAPVWLAKLLKGADPVAAVTRSARSSNAKLKELGWSPAYPKSSQAIAGVIAELVPDSDVEEDIEAPVDADAAEVPPDQAAEVPPDDAAGAPPDAATS